MQLDQENEINKLCALGMQQEGEGKWKDAGRTFEQAWQQADTYLEKLVAAHYLARHQTVPELKLAWNNTALEVAQKIADEGIRLFYPSLYLNIAKCYEDMGDHAQAKANYKNAERFAGYLADDGYGNMIRSGINAGFARTNADRQ